MMAWLLRIACMLLCCPALLQGKASEYQLESETLSECELLRGVAVAKEQDDIPHCTEDGRFRPVQCSGRGQECWCVDAEGQEVIGTRTSISAPHCPSPCQLQSVLQCSPSGLFESVQCDSSRGQCWCVDQDGMELYGTRQDGRPQRCFQKPLRQDKTQQDGKACNEMRNHLYKYHYKPESVSPPSSCSNFY